MIVVRRRVLIEVVLKDVLIIRVKMCGTSTRASSARKITVVRVRMYKARRVRLISENLEVGSGRRKRVAIVPIGL